MRRAPWATAGAAATAAVAGLVWVAILRSPSPRSGGVEASLELHSRMSAILSLRCSAAKTAQERDQLQRMGAALTYATFHQLVGSALNEDVPPKEMPPQDLLAWLVGTSRRLQAQSPQLDEWIRKNKDAIALGSMELSTVFHDVPIRGPSPKEFDELLEELR